MTGRPRRLSFEESLGVGNIRNVMAAAQKAVQRVGDSDQTAGRAPATRAKLLEQSRRPDFLRLLGWRIHLPDPDARLPRNFTPTEMERVGQFPKHEEPVNSLSRPTDLNARQLSFQELGQISIGEVQASPCTRPSASMSPTRRPAELNWKIPGSGRTSTRSRQRTLVLVGMMLNQLSQTAWKALPKVFDTDA